MARKWSNLNLPGALHFVSGNFFGRTPVFTDPACCRVFLEEVSSINQKWPSKLIAHVLMPDHFHLISNPRDGRIREFIGELKSLAAKQIVEVNERFHFHHTDEHGHQVWQESFKAQPLWSGWMIWQKINYIHANPVKARLVDSAKTIPGPAFAHSILGDEPLVIDRDWWWSDDVEKLSQAVKQMNWHR